jgi:hypothetical protein
LPSHAHRLALAVAVLLALTLLPAAAVPSRAVLSGDVPPPSPTPTPTATADPEPEPEPDPEPPEPDQLQAYRGLGTWIDIYDDTYEAPVAAVRKMKRKGVKTIYVETANFHRPKKASRPIYRPRKMARVIEAAHRRDMRVVAWYLPSFQNLRRDYRRSMAAIRFRTRDGHRFDSFALDIEYDGVRDLAKRNRRLLRLSRRLDDAVQPSYAMGAIVPEAGALYWLGFPYAAVAKQFDVFLPMAYASFRTNGYDGVHRFIGRNIREIRAETGDRATPVHAIGGLSADSSPSEVRAFVDAAQQRRSLGASLYSFPGTSRRQWRILQRVD